MQEGRVVEESKNLRTQSLQPVKSHCGQWMGPRVLLLKGSVQIEQSDLSILYLLRRKVIKSILFSLCMDFNITHYSNQELVQLLGLEVVTEESVRATIRDQLSKHPENQDLQDFFRAIQERLLSDLKTRSINPEQKNTITRIIHIDSSHVPLYVENFSSDKFLFQLSDPIPNVTSIKLLSVEIPQSWYTFSALKGNTRFVYYYYTVDYSIYPYDTYERFYYTGYQDRVLINKVPDYVVNSDGYLVDEYGDPITTIYQIPVDGSGEPLYVTDSQQGRLFYIDTADIYVTDAFNNYTVLRDASENPIQNLDASGNPINTRYAIDGNGDIVYAFDVSNNFQYDPSGNFIYRVNLNGGRQNIDNLVAERFPYYQTPVTLSLARYGNVTFRDASNVSYLVDNFFRTTIKENSFLVTLPDGNYTIQSIFDAIKNLVRTGDGTFSDDSFDYTIVKHSGKVILSSEYSFKIMWHDSAGIVPLLNLTYTNYHLGFYLGFNTDITYADVFNTSEEEYPYIRKGRGMTPTDNTLIYHTKFSPQVLNVNGTRYIILELNDFSSNRISNNIVLMNALPRNKVVINDQIKQDLPQIRTGFNTTAVLSGTKNIKNAQLNVINNYSNPLPNGKQLIVRQASNLFAKIPLKRTAFLVYDQTSEDDNKDMVPELGYSRHVAELAGSVQANVREYLGPITLNNIEVSLYDDKGFLLGLNGMHWSCSIVVKSIYQKK